MTTCDIAFAARAILFPSRFRRENASAVPGDHLVVAIDQDRDIKVGGGDGSRLRT
jgi:hypothetical protein